MHQYNLNLKLKLKYVLLSPLFPIFNLFLYSFLLLIVVQHKTQENVVMNVRDVLHMNHMMKQSEMIMSVRKEEGKRNSRDYFSLTFFFLILILFY